MQVTASTPTVYWEHYPHEADMGIRGCGVSPAQAFEQAALALSAIITDINLIEPRESISFSCEAPDIELLFVDFLNTLIYEMAVQQMLFSDFQVSINNGTLNASARGERVDQQKHQPAVEVKGATYTDLNVRQLDDQTWIAQCVVDV